MKPVKFLLMLKKNFAYDIKELLANGRDIYYEGQWVGMLMYTREGQARGFLISTVYGKHLKTMCLLHDQKILNDEGSR